MRPGRKSGDAMRKTVLAAADGDGVDVRPNQFRDGDAALRALWGGAGGGGEMAGLLGCNPKGI